jgi:DNA-binding CsgD family transcriptional regulator
LGGGATELLFLRHIITEKTYTEIARDMQIPVRQVEYIRNLLFERFNVQSRTGLAAMIIGMGLAL